MGDTEAQLIISAVEKQGDMLNRRMDSQQNDIETMKSEIAKLVRIEERQTAFMEQSQESVKRIHNRIDVIDGAVSKRLDAVEAIASENKEVLDKNSWLFSVGSSLVSKLLLIGLMAGGVGSAGYFLGG